ncbi:hypothetical protein LOAG_19153, partial [Loa loa]
ISGISVVRLASAKQLPRLQEALKQKYKERCQLKVNSNSDSNLEARGKDA